MNFFESDQVAKAYDSYYDTSFGKAVDYIEKKIVLHFLKKVKSQEEKPNLKMLELGCGTGHWSQFFLENEFDLTAIDLSFPMLNIAKEKKIPANFIKMSAENLSFPDNSFDIVSSVTMMGFVEDKKKVILEAKRVLRSKGYLLLACLNDLSEIGKNKEENSAFKNAHFFTPKKLVNSLSCMGAVELMRGVYLQNGRLFDEEKEKKRPLSSLNIEPAFLVALVQKK